MKKLWNKIINNHNICLIRCLFHYRDFKKAYDFFKKSQWWNENQIEEYQLHQLKKAAHRSKLPWLLLLRPDQVNSAPIAAIVSDGPSQAA